MFADRMKGHMNPVNYMTNCGAEGGGYFLDVYAATKDAKYLQAAMRIAETLGMARNRSVRPVGGVSQTTTS